MNESREREYQFKMNKHSNLNTYDKPYNDTLLQPETLNKSMEIN